MTDSKDKDNPKDNGKVRIAAIADLHVGESGGQYRELFATIADAADVLLLCGDLTNLGAPKEAEHLAEDLRGCRIPVLAVLGNHDYEKGQADEVKKILSGGKVVFLDDRSFKLRHVGFAGVKGFGGGFDKLMLASFGEEAIKKFVQEAINETLALENHLRSLETTNRVVALHYSPIAATLQGEATEVYPFLGSSRLGEAIDRFEVTAVFHGHAHHGTLEGKTAKGTPVYNCSIELLKRTQAQTPYVLIQV